MLHAVKCFLIVNKAEGNSRKKKSTSALLTESEEELKSLFMKVKEESDKAGLKLNTQKKKIKTFSSITSWQIDG